MTPEPRRWWLVAAAMVAFLVTGAGWALASPIGGSPDDNYHLPSIWCPRPLEGSGCAVRVVEGKVQVEVPEPADASHCHAFKPDQSGACTTTMFSDSRTTWTHLVDQGDYPYGYYQVQHLFVTADVGTTVLLVRAVNVTIAVVLLTVITWLLPAARRRLLLLAVLLSWIPLGIYLIASVNPSSWALTGIIAFAASLLGAAESTGRRAWGLAATAVVGAALAFGSRADAAFFCAVVAAAVLVLQPQAWRRVAVVVPAVVGAVVGLAVFATSGQAGALGITEEKGTFAGRLARNIYSIPEYLADFYGYSRGLGWFDTPVARVTALIGIAAAGAALWAGAGRLSWRTLLSGGLVLGAIGGVPTLIMTRQGSLSLSVYQPRYMLPLLAVFFLVWLSNHTLARIRPAHLVAVVGAPAVAASATLYWVLRRYVTGTDVPGVNLDRGVEWWWNIPVSPMTLWVLCSAAFAVGIGCAVAATARSAAATPPAADPEEVAS